jgi:two-component system heavy metal sensor histidine kinase CusS
VKSSLQTRLVIGVTIALLLLLTVFSVGIYTVIRGALLRQFDASLVSIAQILAASVEVDGEEIELEFEAQQMPEFQDRGKPTYYQLWCLDGTVVAKSPLLDSRELPRLSGSLEKPTFRTIKGIDGRIERVVGFSFIPRLADNDGKATEKQTLTLVVARDNTVVLSQLKFLRQVLFFASTTVMLMSVLVSVLTARQSLRPLKAIAEEIAAIKENDLAARIGTDDVPSELLPIKDRLNDLLSRLEDAFKRERSFTADVAHEMRTPLAGIRSTIEVTLARARDTTEYQTVLSDCLAIVENMQKMVGNLLTITRLDACQVTFCYEQIRLSELVDSCWRPFKEKAIERELVFDNRIPDNVTVNSDRENFSMVLSNLLSNAVEYANKAGRIWLTACQTNDLIEITVSNTGCKLTSEQASHVFDCFWRADSSRTAAGIHCGLGLSLAQRIVRALGGSVIAELQNGGIFTIRLTFPNKSISK